MTELRYFVSDPKKSSASTGSGGSWKSRSSSILEGPTTKYEVRIKTGDESGAASSTEPDAYIKFNGKELSTKEFVKNFQRISTCKHLNFSAEVFDKLIAHKSTVA